MAGEKRAALHVASMIETRALKALWRNHPETAPEARYRVSARSLIYEHRGRLLAWAAAQSDSRLLSCRNIGAKTLSWIRANTPTISSERTTLRDRLASLTDGLARGPFHPIYTYAVGGGRVFDSLENEAGDASFPDGEDIAAVFNALPALLDVLDAARAAVDAGWFTTNEHGDRAAEALRSALERAAE